ncbi:MAG: Ger(x)C family spore germination C-terminal domain-containing protein [Clostridia bacterium]|nr:Ger(x)C family spore germination C-terminal domain-containing protein [Clostridia bacterium]
MKFTAVKFLLLGVFVVFIFFFTNDFGLIDVEKTAIITAIAIDYDSEKNEYEVTTQIAVPEATDTQTENDKAQLSSTGGTMGEAIRSIGDKSGWFPNMQFCNLIIIGNELSKTNTIKVMDYFSKTLRVQDSALVILAEDKASDLLKISTPLDNISSFAIQKILLKTDSFDNDIVSTDIKEFCEGYYSINQSSYLPLVKKVSQNEQNSDSSSSSGGSSGSDKTGGAKGNYIFNATTTALFYKGEQVGELTESETLTFNTLTKSIKGTTLQLKDVLINGKETNVLVTFHKSKPKIKLYANENQLKVLLEIDAYCKLVDQNATYSDNTDSKNVPLPLSVKSKAEEFFRDNLISLIQKEKLSGCDFLNLKNKLYHLNNKYYPLYKDNFFDKLEYEIKVNITGQK